jgi:hypothetical protein
MQTDALANLLRFEQSSIAKRLDAVDRAQVADDFSKDGRASTSRRKEARFL